MLNLAEVGRQIEVVGDRVVTPTSARELAFKVRNLVQTGAYGLYHITNACSWYQIAKAIFELSGLQADIVETTSKAFGAKAPRAPYSVLENGNLNGLGLDDLKPWQEAFKMYLASSGVTPPQNRGYHFYPVRP
jgi:dTDP-4-dehydrorhamnose reductase